jgi:hypothetical protein
MTVMTIPRRFYTATLRRRGFPWVLLLVPVGALLYGLCQYALARELFSQLPARETTGLIVSTFLGKTMQLVWVGLIFMFVAGFDSDPFRVFAQSYAVMVIVLALALPLCFALAPELLPGQSGPLLSTDIQAALVRLGSSAAFLGFRVVAFACFVAQVLLSRTGLEVAGADRKNALYAALIAIGVFVFLNAIGLERIDIPPPPPSQGE